MSDFLVGLIVILVYGAVIFTWVFTLYDLFVRHDLRGWQKALYLFAVVFLPVIGVISYWVLRPKDVRSEEERAFASDVRSWQISEIETLVRLRNQGTISEEEFNSAKQRVMSAA
jgi:hypothetical protein